MQSREKGLINKEYIEMDTHLNFIFKWALYVSTLAMPQNLTAVKVVSSPN